MPGPEGDASARSPTAAANAWKAEDSLGAHGGPGESPSLPGSSIRLWQAPHHLPVRRRWSSRRSTSRPAHSTGTPPSAPIRIAAAEASELQQQQQQLGGGRRSPAASYTAAIAQCSCGCRSDPPPLPCSGTPDAKPAAGNRTDWSSRVLGTARGVGLLGDAGFRRRSGARGGWWRWRRSGEFGGGGGGKSQFPLPLLPLPRLRQRPLSISFCQCFFRGFASGEILTNILILLLVVNNILPVATGPCYQRLTCHFTLNTAVMAS